MTDSHDSPTDDELISAALDGDATDAERQRIEHDPVLADRLRAFTANRDALAAASDALPDDVVDHVVARALEHADHGPAHPADQIAARRRDRTGFRRVPPLAAAAVLLVIAGIGLALALSARSQRTSQSTAGTSVPQNLALDNNPAAASAGSADSNRSAGSASKGTAPSATFLGAFANQSDLATALSGLDAQTLDRSASSAPATPQLTGSAAAPGYTPTDAQLNRCDEVIRLTITRALGARVAVAGATLSGRDVMVLSYDAPASGANKAGLVIAVADTANCYPVLIQNR